MLFMCILAYVVNMLQTTVRQHPHFWTKEEQPTITTSSRIELKPSAVINLGVRGRRQNKRHTVEERKN